MALVLLILGVVALILVQVIPNAVIQAACRGCAVVFLLGALVLFLIRFRRPANQEAESGDSDEP